MTDTWYLPHTIVLTSHGYMLPWYLTTHWSVSNRICWHNVIPLIRVSVWCQGEVDCFSIVGGHIVHSTYRIWPASMKRRSLNIPNALLISSISHGLTSTTSTWLAPAAFVKLEALFAMFFVLQTEFHTTRFKHHRYHLQAPCPVMWLRNAKWFLCHVSPVEVSEQLPWTDS